MDIGWRLEKLIEGSTSGRIEIAKNDQLFIDNFMRKPLWKDDEVEAKILDVYFKYYPLSGGVSWRDL